MSDKKTLVEEGTQFKGALSSNCPVEVKGRIEGDLAAPSLTVSATGAVHGKVKVGALRSEGEIAGEFDADVVQLSGTVKDNTVIRAKSLEVKLSSTTSKLQVIFGECELEIGEQQPAKEAGDAKKAAPNATAGATAKAGEEEPPANGAPRVASVPPPGE